MVWIWFFIFMYFKELGLVNIFRSIFVSKEDIEGVVFGLCFFWKVVGRFDGDGS